MGYFIWYDSFKVYLGLKPSNSIEKLLLDLCTHCLRTGRCIFSFSTNGSFIFSLKALAFSQLFWFCRTRHYCWAIGQTSAGLQILHQIFFYLKRRYHTTRFYNQLFDRKFNQHRTYHIFMLLHAIINNNSPVYLSEGFVVISTIISSRSTGRRDSLWSIHIHRTVGSSTVSASSYWWN